MPKRSPSPLPQTPKTKRAPSDRKPWTPEEEARFAAIVNKLCSENLWNECKNDPVLAARRGSSVRSHWNAVFKKAFKDNT